MNGCSPSLAGPPPMMSAPGIAGLASAAWLRLGTKITSKATTASRVRFN